MSKSNHDMINNWLSDIKEEAFQQGIKYASEKILNNCKAESMPILLSSGDDAFYVSVDIIENIIKIKLNIRR